ncbi:MAG: hypothetical protein FWE89_03620 [Syntrophaceae bacterium]|nr:hypothetical protein [Syntrophaceae bacterium]
MTSESRETRLRQQAEWEAKLQKREALLKSRGADARKITGDVQIRNLKAKVKEAKLRIRAIDANEKRTTDLVAMKAERLAQAEAAKAEPLTPKKKKAEAPAPAPEAKAKKKKKEDGPVKQKA